MTGSTDLSCRGFVALVDDYLDGQLSEDERSSIGAHLDACTDCSSYLHRARIVLAALASRPPGEDEAARDQLDRLRERLRQAGS